MKKTEKAVADEEGEDTPTPWFQNAKSLLVIMLVLGSALSLPYFRKLIHWFPNHHPGLLALIAGVIVAMVTYPPMRFADPKYALSNSILLGLLVAEFVVYGAPFDFPAPVAISFFFFMYSYGYAEAKHLWPESYQGRL